jgi:probable HAF family extracellular repeat protein
MHCKSRFYLWLFVAFALVPLAGAQVYRTTDLGTLPGGSYSYATGLNNLGQVSGFAEVVNSFGILCTHAFLWTKNGGMQDLGTAHNDFDDQEEFFNSRATGLNDFGAVAGWSWINLSQDHAILWSSNGLQDLGDLPHGMSSYARSINLFGQVVGGSSEFPGNSNTEFGHAFLWTRTGGMQALGTLPGGRNSYAYSINNPGQVVGSSNTEAIDGAPQTHAFLWTKRNGMVDLGEWNAAAINNLGTVVGNNGSHAVTWTSKKGVRDLGTLPGGTGSAGLAINDFGEVVGWSNSSADLSTSHAALWWKHSAVWDLNSLIAPGSGWVLNTATGINFWGQIVGTGTIDGQNHAFLLTPNFLIQ